MRTLSISTFLLLVSVLGLFGQTKPVRVGGQTLPASLTAPTVIVGPSLATVGIVVDTLIIANTDTADHTVTVSDCTSGTAFLLFNAYTITAGTTWVLNLNGIQFTGCFKWTASSTTVMGTLVGRY